MSDADTVVVLNPAGGGGDVAEEVRARARRRGFALRETEERGDGVRFTRDAAEAGVERVVAAGGDGTINEVVQGLADADALDSVTMGVVPAGTGNNFAANVGVESVADGFDLLDGGPVRRLDLGVGGDRVFVNSCVGGLTAEASERTDADRKRRWGVLAYVIATMQTLAEFETLPLTVEIRDDEGEREVWSGDAAFVLVGNARRFGARRVAQADAEDGRFEVTIVTGSPAGDLLEAATSGSLIGPDAEYVYRRLASGLEVRVHDAPVSFSFDGEMVERTDLELHVCPRVLSLHVGEGYDPDPPAWPSDERDDEG